MAMFAEAWGGVLGSDADRYALVWNGHSDGYALDPDDVAALPPDVRQRVIEEIRKSHPDLYVPVGSTVPPPPTSIVGGGTAPVIQPPAPVEYRYVTPEERGVEPTAATDPVKWGEGGGDRGTLRYTAKLHADRAQGYLKAGELDEARAESAIVADILAAIDDPEKARAKVVQLASAQWNVNYLNDRAERRQKAGDVEEAKTLRAQAAYIMASADDKASAGDKTADTTGLPAWVIPAAAAVVAGLVFFWGRD